MKKKYTFVKTIIIAFLALFIQQLEAQTITVNSLEDLLPYLKLDNVDVKLAPGDYSINAFDITAGKFSNPLFLFEGSDSTYDFTDVKISINTLVLTKFGNNEVNELQILGNNNVLKNLTIEDIGTTAPSDRAQSIIMDGRDNRIEGFNLTVRGSYPYGYGDAFGKGGGAVIAHNKHSGVLIRGLRNHLKDCNIISRSYGHIVFMQAASYPTIEGCYIEGEMRTTDDMLLEENTGSPADNVDFMTDWGYRLPPGYMMSLQEGGIRAYNAGTTYIDGVEIQRGTDNPTVKDCTIKNARTGVTLVHATGTKHVENVTLIGCEQGYSIGSGTVINCSGDAQYGPVLSFAYSSDKNTDIDINVLPAEGPYYNGSGTVAYIGGSAHNITLHGNDPNANLKIQVGGDKNNVRVLGEPFNQNPLTASNLVLNNQTDFPVVLDAMSSNVTGESCGEITDNGTSNNVVDCGETVTFPDPSAIYLINNPRWTARLGADGGNEVLMLAETASTTTAQWKFTPVPSESGYYYMDCVGGGDKPRVTANDGSVSIMQASTVTDDSAKWRFDLYDGDLFHITNKNDKRLRGVDTYVDIVETDSNGSYTRFSFTSMTLNTNDVVLEEDITIFPVPTSGVLNIQFRKSVSGKVELLDITGKILISSSIKNRNTTLNLSNFPTGIYIARIYSGESVSTKKIVKK
ncbi:putative secreted protein (Por secretion system target) [Mariniflexile fucanivorans]|uniref:Putative secreted protein (Por secretion system target) n=1 Tax=Mariniflexile fucanivorans TaxID=264023 RepID=A0A4R1RJ98_9FLAO|nr:T9SS type A sorting domain-containing protein [Mariniflexile fucanivorans]TCL66204.1 putative secreted protein (Por secretion system target) [Mariniflexile fucanivorans]